MDHRLGASDVEGGAGTSGDSGAVGLGAGPWGVLLRSLRHWYGLVGRASPGARTVELEGVTACLVPAAPERSVFNAVLYRSPDRLIAVLAELEQIYRGAGIEAWCVWVPRGERRAAEALERSGHRLDASPAAMIRELPGVDRPPVGALEDWNAGAPVEEAAAVNDSAYGYDTDSFARGLSQGLHGEAHVYCARQGGRPVATVVTSDHEGNCEVDLVATVPAARGRGTAGALLAHALADASERGCSSTTLVATRLGRPVYERLGYRTLGTIDMWELRRAGDGSGAGSRRRTRHPAASA